MQTHDWDPFAALTDDHRQLLNAYEEMLRRFNDRVNLISSNSERHIQTQHLLHCLTLSFREFPAGSTVVDWGTGGGLPAIPLAIRFPEVTFVGVDSVSKKARAVRTMARRLGLENCYAWAGRAADWGGEAHYSVSRATAPLDQLWQWHRRVVVDLDTAPAEDEWPQGLLVLKGGDLTDEVAALQDIDSEAEVERGSLQLLLGRNGFFGEKELVAVRGG